jgi:hypothetical protein
MRMNNSDADVCDALNANAAIGEERGIGCNDYDVARFVGYAATPTKRAIRATRRTDHHVASVTNNQRGFIKLQQHSGGSVRK